MDIVADLHTHTLASSHAFSTLNEMVEKARCLGYRAMAVTDHGKALPDSPHEWYFHNITSLPTVLEDGFVLLKGAEANPIGRNGDLDMEDEILKSLDWVIAALHSKCISPLSFEDATQLWLQVAQHPYVDMIGHPEEGRWKFDYERVVPVFKQNNKIVELNGNSPVARKGNERNLRELLLCCKKYGAKIAVNSDAHSTYNMGQLGWAFALLEELAFPEELIVNTSFSRFHEELVLHGRPVASRFSP
ncbi:phosphatase [Ruminococcaceae bacterium OttesenSCG-928-I18]|nr:phosphatase [Ruminococcaceae bacterium OttesenSCG-928-I18]